jgi:hypothetical protein
MNEMFSNNHVEHSIEKIVQVEPSPVEEIEAGPVGIDATALDYFTQEEIARLCKVKQAVAEGRYSDLTPEHRKLLFVQWLVDHGRLKS